MIRSILITGGGSGIGASLALALADRGCQVVVSGRRTSPLDEIADQSSQIEACPADVTDKSDQARLIQALSKLPAPRAVFHGAGYFQLGHLENLSLEDWKASFETNVTARWALSKACLPHLDGGRILFIGSDSGGNIREGAAAYSIAQSASETLRRALQAEWSNRNVAVAAFKPGLVNTDLVQNLLLQSETEFPARRAFQEYIDRGEFSKPETVATFAAWLLCDVNTDRFSETEWDIRDASHHAEWVDKNYSI